MYNAGERVASVLAYGVDALISRTCHKYMIKSIKSRNWWVNMRINSQISPYLASCRLDKRLTQSPL